MPIVTSLGTIVFPSVFETAKDMNGQDSKRYAISLILKADDPVVAKLEALVKETLAAQTGGKIPRNWKTPVRRDKDGVPEDCVYITCRTGFRPSVVDLRRQPVTDPQAVFHGCEGRIVIPGAYYYNTAGNTGVGLNFDAIQVTGRDGVIIYEGGGGNTKAESLAALGDLDLPEDDLLS